MANYVNYYSTEENFGGTGQDDPPSYQHVIDHYTNGQNGGQPSSLGYSNVVVGEVESYGRALFPFKAEFPNELSLKENEIVHLIRHVNNDWTEGEVDGKVGIFPKTFIEIIVDCDQNTTEDGNQNNSISIDFPPDSFGRVLFDFEAQVEGDLTIRKGDTLTLIRKMDNWFDVMDDSGNVGLVPGNYIEVIEDTSGNVSATPSAIEDAINSTNQNTDYIPGNGFTYSNTSILNEGTTPPDTSHTEVKPEIVEDFEPFVSLSANQSNNFESLGDSKSPKTPLRAAPDLPRSPTNLTAQQLSPHRPPPPVPKHKSNKYLQRSTESIDSINLNRHDPIRASITSNSSSGSGKSDVASGVSIPVPSVEDQRRTEERRKKVREQRSCVIMELLQTERDYRQNLNVCADIFLKKPEEAQRAGVDLDKLFGNLEEVIEVSSRLVQLLEESTLMKIYEQQRVGKCFLEIADQMKKAYSTYCRNHDEIQPLWNRYEAQPEAKQYLQKGLDRMRDLTNCFDVPSVLIKPVQRILKYPLLLNELHKCTEDGHEDKPDLILAIDLITNMATNINESKRRQDLVFKYREERCQGLSHRLSKITLHTVMKKGSRFGHRITSTLGLSSSTKDDEFDLAVQRFRTVEKTIKIFAKDKQAFMKSVEDFSNQGLKVVEAVALYYDKKNRQQEVEQLRDTHRVIVSQYWVEFKAAVDANVTPVLDRLIAKFTGPNQLIKKRNDKLTDFDSLNRKIECNKDMTRQRGLHEQQTLAKNVYEALNNQLLEELPKLCDISMQILQDCIQAFLLARKRLIGRIAKHHLSLLELPLVMGFTAGSAADISETFQIKHNLICEQLLDEISILPPSVFPNATAGQSDLNRKHSSRGSRRSLQLSNVNVSVVNSRDVNRNPNKNVSQSASQRAYLQSRYQKYQLYEAIKPYEAVDVLDICLNKGDLVGVIKQQDPTGAKHRWYVDAGSAQGFVLAAILVPYHEDGWAAPPNWQSTVSETNGQSVSEKVGMTMSENQAPVANSKADMSGFSPVAQPSIPLIQHQYKIYPSTDTPVQLRHEVEERRYEVVEDSPPRYSTLATVNPSDLLSFEESPEKHIESQSHRYSNFDEFDPLAPHEEKQTYQTNNSVMQHRYEEIAEEGPPPATPQRTSSQMEVYFAAYPFTAGDPNQLSLDFGQSVAVQHKCDVNGNAEWWFVVDSKTGKQGYVPANYLTKHKA